MIKIACICLAVVAATPAWSQVTPSASGGGTRDDAMMTPAPVSADGYPAVTGAEARSNYFSGGLVFTGEYIDNLLLGNLNGSTADETYSFTPTISFDRETTRQGESIHYGAGFTLYQKTSSLNSVNQNGSAEYQFHISPYTHFYLSDEFLQNSNLYNQGNPFVGNGVSVTPGSPNAVVIAPFQNLLDNSSSAGLSYQYSRRAMIGGSGTYSFSRYSNLTAASGLNDGNTTSGSAFFSNKMGHSQYLGTTFQISKITTHPVDTNTLTQTLLAFYTIYLTRSLSVSILGGPEHYSSQSAAVASHGSWTPAVQGSFGMQTSRTSLSGSYSYTVSGATGLVGAFHSNVGALNSRLLLTRKWSVGVNGNYASFKNVNGNVIQLTYGIGGHTLSGGVYAQHSLTEKVNVEGGYGHFSESYPSIPVATSSPNSSRVYVSLSFQFQRPLGR